jgi:hypothetical protein
LRRRELASPAVGFRDEDRERRSKEFLRDVAEQVFNPGGGRNDSSLMIHHDEGVWLDFDCSAQALILQLVRHG